jgi:hypothetical protein
MTLWKRRLERHSDLSDDLAVIADPVGRSWETRRGRPRDFGGYGPFEFITKRPHRVFLALAFYFPQGERPPSRN